jgi:hypothetical protein
VVIVDFIEQQLSAIRRPNRGPELPSKFRSHHRPPSRHSSKSEIGETVRFREEQKTVFHGTSA